MVWNAAGNLQMLHRFTSWPDGQTPDAPLIRDAAGNLYGTAARGGDLTHARRQAQLVHGEDLGGDDAHDRAHAPVLPEHVHAEAGGAVPGSDEGVLEDVGDGVGVGAASRQPGGDPQRVAFVELPEGALDEDGDHDGEFDPDEDQLLEKAIEIVVQTQTASVSLLQRRLRVGYTRAGRLIDMLERRGIISGYEGSKPRRVLVDEAELERFVISSS